jgi:Sulfotransferase family
MHPEVNHPYTGHNLVFIVGAPRSGTTWLQRLLATHSQIRTGQESKLFRWYIGPQLQTWRMETTRELDPKTATGRGGTGLSCYFREDEFLSALKQYLGLLLQPMIGSLRPGELFVEKSPSHAMCIPEIKRLLPEARIIHVLRDPRDVVASLLAASRTWGAAWAPHTPAKAAGLWVEHVRAVKQAAQNLSRTEFHEVKYEQLRSSPERALREVADYLGLEWKDLEIQKAIETNLPDSDGGTPIPVYGEVSDRIGGFVKEPAGFIRKARPGTWKADLSLLEKAQVWRVCHKVMREMGYR